MNVEKMKTQLLSLADTFKDKESELTDLDRSIGDGDHGVNMERGFSHLKDNIDDKDMASLFKSTGMTLMSNIGGASDHYMALVLSKCLVLLRMKSIRIT